MYWNNKNAFLAVKANNDPLIYLKIGINLKFFIKKSNDLSRHSYFCPDTSPQRQSHLTLLGRHSGLF